MGWILRALLFIMLFLATFISLGLAGYHLYLAASNQTTYEMIKPQVLDNYLRDEMQRKQQYHDRLQEQQRREEQQRVDRERAEMRLREQQNDGPQEHPQNNQQEKPQEHPQEQRNEDNKYGEDEMQNGDNNDIGSDQGNDAGFSSDNDHEPLKSPAANGQPGAVRRRMSATPFASPGVVRETRTGGGEVNYIERESKHYFDEGLKRNIVMFLTGKMYPEWKSALPCISHTQPATITN